MSERPNPYETLGVTKDASEKDIKNAFRKAAKNCHPDLFPGNTEKEAEFKTYNEAYDVLKDEDLRKKFDRGGWDAVDGNDTDKSSVMRQSVDEKAESFSMGGGGIRQNANDSVVGKRRGKSAKRKPSFRQ